MLRPSNAGRHSAAATLTRQILCVSAHLEERTVVALGLHDIMDVSHAGCREGHGKIPCAESACCHKDVWPEVSAAGCVTADCGALILLEMPQFLASSLPLHQKGLAE